MLEYCVYLFRLSVPPHTFGVLLLIGGFLAIVGCLEAATNGGRDMNSAVPRSVPADHTTTVE
ncbi:MAG TPA: hypothetical protein VJS11_14485 [Acidobacteriaceae bacterium]|nr:hypothetical protein [Acidobacteriaceae bacterium]